MTIPKNLTYEQVYNFALEVFQYDKDKTNHFWMSKQDMFDGMSPYELVKCDRGQWLMRYLQRCVL